MVARRWDLTTSFVAVLGGAVASALAATGGVSVEASRDGDAAERPGSGRSCAERDRPCEQDACGARWSAAISPTPVGVARSGAVATAPQPAGGRLPYSPSESGDERRRQQKRASRWSRCTPPFVSPAASSIVVAVDPSRSFTCTCDGTAFWDANVVARFRIFCMNGFLPTVGRAATWEEPFAYGFCNSCTQPGRSASSPLAFRQVWRRPADLPRLRLRSVLSDRSTRSLGSEFGPTCADGNCGCVDEPSPRPRRRANMSAPWGPHVDILARARHGGMRAHRALSGPARSCTKRSRTRPN